MTPKDPFLEGTFCDKFWRPLRSRALLFTPDLWGFQSFGLEGIFSRFFAEIPGRTISTDRHLKGFVKMGPCGLEVGCSRCCMWALHELQTIPNFTKIMSKMLCKISAVCIRSHSGTPALKTGHFTEKIGRFSKTQKRIY